MDSFITTKGDEFIKFINGSINDLGKNIGNTIFATKLNFKY